MIARGHIQNNDVLAIVVVDIGDVHTHAVKRDLVGHGFDPIGKGPVLVIDVCRIRYIIVVGDIDIEPSVHIEVTDAQSESEGWFEHTRRSGNICELSIVITIKMAAIRT